MKRRTSIFVTGAFLCLIASLVFINCTQEPLLEKALDEQYTETIEIPAEVAAYMTKEEKEAFYAGPPSYTPSSNEVSDRNPRKKKWRPFFTWGDIVGHFYPVLSNCDDPLNAEICFDISDCPDESTWVGFFGGFIDNEVHMTGYGKVDQSWMRFGCGPLLSEAGKFNGSYEKGESTLQHWLSGPGSFTLNPDGTANIDMPMTVCNSAYPEPTCWQYSTGDFADAEGSFTLRLTITPIPYGMFEDQPGHVSAWGWLYY